MTSSALSRCPAQFAATRWSVVLAAARPDLPESRNALEDLCRAYWNPLYIFVRSRGYSHEDASDLTQSFFAHLLEKKALGTVDPAKGRFRSFLLVSIKNFLANEWDRASAAKRGGGQPLLPLDAQPAGELAEAAASQDLANDRSFDREWALTVLQRAVTAVEQEYAKEGKSRLFEALKTTLTTEKETLRYRQLSLVLGMSENAIKVAVYRLRQRYRQVLRDEIAQTVSTPAEVEDELLALFAALGND